MSATEIVSIHARPEGRAILQSLAPGLIRRPFQSTPDLKAGRYEVLVLTTFAVSMFQSTPDLKAGRYVRPGASLPRGEGVSIHARPEGRAIRWALVEAK